MRPIDTPDRKAISSDRVRDEWKPDVARALAVATLPFLALFGLFLWNQWVGGLIAAVFLILRAAIRPRIRPVSRGLVRAERSPQRRRR